MRTPENKSKKCKIVEEYLQSYDPRQKVEIGFSIPDAYRYAEKVNKPISELTEEELQQFAVK